MYTVKILPSEEFDKLPFSDAYRALGAADPKTNIAYVRDTGYNDITKHTIEHELDELMASHSPHEIDGIRYKIPILGPIFSGLGKVAGAAASGIGNVASTVGGAALKGAQSLGNFLTPGPAIFGPAAKGAATSSFPAYSSIRGSQGGGNVPVPMSYKLGSNLTGFPQAPFTTSAQGGNVFDTFGKSVLSSSGTNIPTGREFLKASDLKAPPQSFMASLFSGANDLLKGAFAPTTTGPGQAGQPGQPAQPQSILDMFKGAAPGAAVSLLGNLFAPKVEPPDFSSVTDPLRSRITGETTGPAFDLGFGEAKRVIDQPLGTVPEEVFAQSEKLRNQQLADDLNQLRNQFKSLNPTADVENNSAFLREKSRLEERAREDKANSRAAVSFEFTNQEVQRRLSTMQTLLNLDQAQTSQLIQLAQLDVASIMTRTGISVEEANQVKQLFGGFGEMMMRKGLGLDNANAPTNVIK